MHLHGGLAIRQVGMFEDGYRTLYIESIYLHDQELSTKTTNTVLLRVHQTKKLLNAAAIKIPVEY